MAQLFVSHSARDTDLVDFFARLGARTKVRLIFEELEKLIAGLIDIQRIRQDILGSNALLLLLSRHVQSLPHTRDWVGSNKDIWVFERASDAGHVSVVTPYLRHYIVFEPNDSYFTYLTPVLESYDDSHVLGTVATATGLGALLGGGGGAFIGLLAGAALSDRTSIRPRGVEVRCAECSSFYSAHLPVGTTRFRCPVCNIILALPGV